jgi:N-acyl-D-aspartate/D-glutamate deacylase
LRFEDTKGVIRIRKSKDRQHNDQRKKYKRTTTIYKEQTIGIPMGMNCAPSLADLFLYAFDADFFQGLLKNKQKIGPEL